MSYEKNVLIIIAFIIFSCKKEDDAKSNYPMILAKDIYEVTKSAIKKSQVTRTDLDLHPATIYDYINQEEFKKDSYYSTNNKERLLQIFSESDFNFMSQQNIANKNFVWDNFVLKFKQNETFYSYRDISVPVFSTNLRFALIAIENHNSSKHCSAIVHLLERRKNSWKVKNELKMRYIAHFGEFKMKGCKCCKRTSMGLQFN